MTQDLENARQYAENAARLGGGIPRVIAIDPKVVARHAVHDPEGAELMWKYFPLDTFGNIPKNAFSIFE